MKKKPAPQPQLKLTKEQWSFLAVMDAFNEPVSLDILGTLVPLQPSPLIDLLSEAESRDWIKRPESKLLVISDGLSSKARLKLSDINSRENLSLLVDRIHEEKLASRISTRTMSGILQRAGRFTEAGLLEVELARESFENQDHEQRCLHLKSAVLNLSHGMMDPEICRTLIFNTLQWSNATFVLGKIPHETESFLHKALEASEVLGDLRARALLNLHLGRLYYFTDRRDEALVALSLGVDEIEDLDDADMATQSSLFIGIYYFIQGKHKKAFPYLEKAHQLCEEIQDPILKDPVVPIFLGYCAAYTGQFHRAIGLLDYCTRNSQEGVDLTLVSTMRAVLGTVLAWIGKEKEAGLHLEKAYKEARQANNLLGLYFCGGGLALNYFSAGESKKAYEILVKTVNEGIRGGLVRQFASPWILEMLYEFHQLGFDPIPSFELPEGMDRIMDGANIHLQGVCLRLKAKMNFGLSGTHMKISECLDQSLSLLRDSGDPVQVSKTLMEMAQFENIQGHRARAQEIAREALTFVEGNAGEFFQKEFRHLLDDKDFFLDKEINEERFLDTFLELLESLYPGKNQTEILTKMLSATSQMLGAERSGFFWFPNGAFSKEPQLRASMNLPIWEIQSSSFKLSMTAVHKAKEENKPFSEKLLLNEFSLGKEFIRSVLCIPIEVKQQGSGVLYYDNSYLDNAFEFLNLSMIRRMIRHTSIVVERNIDYLKVKSQANRLANEKLLLLGSWKGKVITQSKSMLRLMEQIEQVAQTESTVLILGETGTGKELVARFVHEKSLRAGNSFVIVDSTTIPDNLIESELFGHEKGSFTGAETRKIGCIEMADKGTLFLDEVGELSLAAQAKLLRALQEKTIRRVGGLSLIPSDFRLVAATNRDLVAEMKKGRFREDLFYRLNVVPFKLPPLRSRDRDPVLLARFFIAHYTKKYMFQDLELSTGDEESILNYPWPGNIRELKNVVERAVLLSGGTHLEFDLSIRNASPSTDLISDLPTLNELQRRYIRHVLDHTNGKVSGSGGACEILGVKRPSFYSKMNALGYKKKIGD
jgi:transcriptional regulator with GAF, ATPase, and Fis domain